MALYPALSFKIMKPWKANRTLLIVGEGYTEEAFLQHVKALYAPRGCGLAVTIKNARGKGARHVIDWTRRQIANAAYNKAAVLLDTDQDWSPTVEKLAKRYKIKVLRSEPRFEALMLRVLGKEAAGNAKEMKKQLAPFVNGDALKRKNYETHFNQKCLEAARIRESTLDELLGLFIVN